MPDFDKIEDTLFVPMLGRIYATENFPAILDDRKALSLKDRLPDNIKGKDTQTQYTLLASAVRSANMDRYIRDFAKRYPGGAVIQLGCGLETTLDRCNLNCHWYEVDLPDVIEYRKTLLPEAENETCIAGSAFDEDWIKQVRAECPDTPLLVTASGLFYYFEKDKVMALFKMLKNYGNIEIAFDTVNSKGLRMIGHYMKQVGHADAPVYFAVDDPEEITRETGAASVIQEKYYADTPRRGLKFMSAVSMKVADWLMLVKLIHIRLNDA